MSNKLVPGTKVLYVPNHALDNPNHPDIERGEVKEIRRRGVIVQFKTDVRKCDPRWLEVQR